MVSNNNNGQRSNVLFAIIITVIIGVCSWALLGMIATDKKVHTMEVENSIEHDQFEKTDETILREQRSMSRKVDAMNTTITKIATKLDVD
jgi:hypothetical protein